MADKVSLPRAPVSPFVQKAAAAWPSPSFAYKPPNDAQAHLPAERPHERLPSSKGARGLIELRK